MARKSHQDGHWLCWLCLCQIISLQQSTLTTNYLMTTRQGASMMSLSSGTVQRLFLTSYNAPIFAPFLANTDPFGGGNDGESNWDQLISCTSSHVATKSKKKVVGHEKKKCLIHKCALDNAKVTWKTTMTDYTKLDCYACKRNA